MGETVLIEISRLLASYGALAAIIAGVILAGILAATMSTADSQLLAAASSVSKDILNGVFWKNMSEKTAMLLAANYRTGHFRYCHDYCERP